MRRREGAEHEADAEAGAGVAASRFCVAMFALAAGALGFAIHLKDGEYTRVAIGWVTVSLVCCTIGTFARDAAPVLVRIRRLDLAAFGIALALCFYELLTSSPSVDLTAAGAGGLRWFRIGVATAALLSFALLLGRRSWRTPLIVLLLAIHFALGAWAIRSSPDPRIDVYVFQRDASRALRRGENPYALTFPDVYHSEAPGARQVYGPGISRGGTLHFGFPYAPLSLLLACPADALTGDYRFAQLAAMTLAGALMAFLGRSRMCSLAAALYLFTPRSFFILTRGWTEPFLVLFLAATVFCAVRRYRLTPIALGLFLASKQYLVLAVPLAVLLPERIRWATLARLLGWAVLVAFLVTAPLALWDWRACYYSTVVVQKVAPYRTDALSYLNAYLDWRGLLAPDGSLPPAGSLPPVWLAFAVALPALLLVLWRGRRGPAGFAAAVAFVFLPFIALNKQAFANYYSFVIGALCCAAAAEGKRRWGVESGEEGV